MWERLQKGAGARLQSPFKCLSKEFRLYPITDGRQERFLMSDMTSSHCRAKYSGSRMAWRQEDELEAARMIPGKSESRWAQA